MKKISFSLIVFLLCGSCILAQNITDTVLSTNFEYNSSNQNNHSFRFTTNFFEANPQNNSHEIEVIGDTLFVKVYYNVIGFWVFESFNQSVDNFLYNEVIPASVRYIKMSTNAITYGENPPFEPITVTDIYSRVIDLNNLSINSNHIKKIIVYPNPTRETINISNNFLFESAIVLNNIGQKITTFYKNKEDIYNIESLPNGVYYISFYDNKNDKVGVSKVIKQN